MTSQSQAARVADASLWTSRWVTLASCQNNAICSFTLGVLSLLVDGVLMFCCLFFVLENEVSQ